jgi:hypothetical protein
MGNCTSEETQHYKNDYSFSTTHNSNLTCEQKAYIYKKNVIDINYTCSVGKLLKEYLYCYTTNSQSHIKDEFPVTPVDFLNKVYKKLKRTTIDLSIVQSEDLNFLSVLAEEGLAFFVVGVDFGIGTTTHIFITNNHLIASVFRNNKYPYAIIYGDDDIIDRIKLMKDKEINNKLKPLKNKLFADEIEGH